MKWEYPNIQFSNENVLFGIFHLKIGYWDVRAPEGGYWVLEIGILGYQSPSTRDLVNSERQVNRQKDGCHQIQYSASQVFHSKSLYSALCNHGCKVMTSSVMLCHMKLPQQSSHYKSASILHLGYVVGFLCLKWCHVYVED